MGEVLGQIGRYQILAEIGHGGYATVYRALDTILEREVALKVMRPLLMSDFAFVARFRAEAKAAAQLEHPHVIPIYDYGDENGRVFIAMKLLRRTIADVVNGQGSIPFARAVQLTQQIAAALDHAHQRGLIHRDVKPANVLLDDQDNAVLTDFGLVKAMAHSPVTQSLTGGILGTPAYIAPEMWNDAPASSASDQYALACVLYEMLTGAQLFAASTPAATMGLHYKPLSLPDVWPADVPPGIAAVLGKALTKDPAERYSSVAAFATAVGALLADPLAEPYAALVAAIAQENWSDALALGERIAAQDPGYRDVASLLTQAVTGKANADKAGRSAQWRQQAEAAIQAGDLALARTAIRQWQSVEPESTQARMLLTVLDAPDRQPAELPGQPPVEQPPATRGRRRLPIVAFATALLALLLIGWLGSRGLSRSDEPDSSAAPLVALVTDTATATATPTATSTATASATATPTASPTPSRTATATATPQPSATPTPPPTATVAAATVPQAGQSRGFTLPSGLQSTMVYVPSGPFTMGSNVGPANERPVHEVTLNAFWIDRTEVTNRQYADCVAAGACGAPGSNGSFARDAYYNADSFQDYPVINVSWFNAQSFCQWRGARLPTEAEWEKAARGTSGQLYPWGDNWDGARTNMCDVNCPRDWRDGAVDDGYGDTAPVGNYPNGASPYRALDMVGNVWEWVADWFVSDYYAIAPGNNPLGPETGGVRTVRGGSWNSIGAVTLTSTRGDFGDPARTYSHVGFRCAVTANP